MADHNPELSVTEAKAHMWQAKTDSAARAVPFDFDPRTELAVERFFDRYTNYPHSRQSVNRRVDKAADAAPELDPTGLYPHALRATAATYHAGRGLDVLPLQGFMGWAQPSTAQCYVQHSPENTARALHQIHSR
jgi:site-specific recombinase XerD